MPAVPVLRAVNPDESMNRNREIPLPEIGNPPIFFVQSEFYNVYRLVSQ